MQYNASKILAMKKKDWSLSEILNMIIKYIFLILFSLLWEETNGQSDNPPVYPGEVKGSFQDLITMYKLVNIKSGLVCTGQRNDTIFAIFYLSILNNLACIPIGDLKSNDYFVYENMNQPVFWELRATDCILTSKITSSFSLKREQIFIIHQTLGSHITIRTGEDPMERIYERVLFYSKERGIYDIEYIERSTTTLTGKSLKWPYMEGDLLFSGTN